MPELPEVETIARGLAQRVTGDVVESVWLGQKKEPLKSPASEIAEMLEYSRIVAVRRMGKHIVFDLVRNRVARALLPAKSRRADRKVGGKAVASTTASSSSIISAGAGGGGRGRPPHTYDSLASLSLSFISG